MTVALRRSLGFGPAMFAGVVALAALWPLSAYAVDPAILPLLIFAVGAGAVVVKRPEYGLALVVALSPLTNLQLQGFILGPKPVQAMIPILVFALLAWGVVAFKRDRTARARGLALPVALFGIAALASSVQAIDASAAINKLLLVFTACALFLAVIQVCRTRQAALVVVAGCVVALLIGGLHGVSQQVLGTVGEAGFMADGEVVARVQGTFGHANQYAGFLALLIPIAVALFFTREVTPGLRALSAVAVAIGMAGLTLSYTRGAVIGLVLGGLVWLALMRPKLALGTLLVVIVASITLAPATLKDRFADGESSDVTLRQDLWGSALDVYGESPVLGVGLSNFKEGYARLPASLANASQRRLLHNRQILIPPHAANLYLNVLAEEGLVGFAVLALLAIAALAAARRGSRGKDPLTRAVSMGVGAGLVGIGFHSIFEVTLFSELIVPLFALLAVVVSLLAVEQEAEPEPVAQQ